MTRKLITAAAHVCLLAATCCNCNHHHHHHASSSHVAEAFIYSTHATGRFRQQQYREANPAVPTGNSVAAAGFSSLPRLRRMTTRTTMTLQLHQQQPQQPQRQHSHHHHRLHHQWREAASRCSHVRRSALPEDTTPASASEDETNSSSSSSSSSGGGGGGGSSPGLDKQFISKLARRMADSFPLLTAEEIKSEVRALLNPETKANKAAGTREDNLALLAKEVRELVEDLMERVGSSTDAKAGLVELKGVAQKFKGVLKADPVAVQELRRQVLDDLEEVREEIEELLEVKELSKARERLEKATAESTEMVFDSAVAAMVTGLNKVVNEGKDAIPEGEETERFQVSTYVYGEDNEFWDDMRANGVTRQRFFTYSLLGVAVALGGNLFGITSGLLSSVAPEASRGLRVDLLFPVGGFKRFYSPEDGYEFMYPQTWVGDSGLALRRQRDLEDMRASPAAVAKARQRRASSAPEVAFGPQGGDGVENVSVVKSELMPGFSLKKTLGEPNEAAEKLLSTVIAPPGSGREWELLNAFEDNREPGGLVYQFEYRVQGQRIRKPMRNVGVVAARGSTLFTVTVLAPEESWGGERGEKFRQMAKSFRLTF